MRTTLEEIRQRIEARAYKNEEHVRLCIVCRLLSELGWDIWNPQEVNTEFVCNPHEDNTKVDVALSAPNGKPDVFIEIKAIGQMRVRLPDIERQLRDYNRNNNATFSIITDGQEWRFYYSLTQGTFADKLFKVLHLQRDQLDELESSFAALLSKSAIRNGSAEQQATAYLKLNQRQRVMEEFLPDARRKAMLPPFPSLPLALSELVREQGMEASLEEATAFISEFQERKPVAFQPQPAPVPSRPAEPERRASALGESSHQPTVRLNPEHPGRLHFAKIITGRIGQREARGWSDLVKAGIRLALEKGITIGELQTHLTIRMRAEPFEQDGYRWDPDLRVSIQGFDATKAGENLFKLARLASEELLVRFYWRQEPGAEHPGAEGIIHWTP